MRKRTTRPERFAAVDNGAIDQLPSLLSVGMLTRMIRARNGTHVTVETMQEQYDEGKVLLTKAMRTLVDNAYVVKFKIQRAQQETVYEGGKRVVKPGGSWYTDFEVDSIPFTEEDVARSLDEILNGGNARAVRIEPEHLDPRRSSDMQDPVCRARPAETPDNPSSAPTYSFLTVGDPTVGESAALYKTGSSKTPPLSSVDQRKAAVAEPVVEEETGDDDSTPSTESRGDLPQERKGGEEMPSADKTPHGVLGASVDVQGFIASLPGVNGQQAAAQGQLEHAVADALGRGFTTDTLRSALVRHTDWQKARDPKVIPSWYLNAFAKIGEAPKAAAALCDNPAHARERVVDPINGGCLHCNLTASRGTVTKTTVKPVPVADTDGMVTAGAMFRESIRQRRFNQTEPSRKQTPAQRASDEAEAARSKANDLLHEPA